MFNIDFDDKRVKSTLRSLQYAALTLMVVVGTVILVLAGQGYDFNAETGQVIRNGLILVNSTPEDANVYLDGELESDLTPSRFPVPDGEYRISIWREGYRDWNKIVSVTGSEVEWLYYPLLVPEELATDNLAVFLRPEFASVSPGGDNFLIRQTSDEPVFNLISYSPSGVSDEETLTLPAGLLELGSGELGSFEFQGWADDNRHALITHGVGNRLEYVWLDTQDVSESRNLTQDFDLNLREVRFIDGNPDELYTIVTNDLRRLNLDNDTISAPIARNVRRYVLHEDRFVVFLRSEDGASQLGLIDGNQEPRILSDLPEPAGNYRLEFAEFESVFYLALLDLQAGRMSLTPNPQLANLGTSQISLVFNQEDTDYISFSKNGQFITMQADKRFLTYDLDRKRRSSFSVGFELGKDPEARWLDGYRMTLADGDELLRMFEFDGANETELLESSSSLNPIYSSGQNVLYSFTSPAEGGRVFLQGTPFTIPEN